MPEMITKTKGFMPVRGSSAFSGVGGAGVVSVDCDAAVSVVTGVVTGSSFVIIGGGVGFGAASKTIRDFLRGVGALNSERASVPSVIVTHLSERALITVIVYASPDSRRSARDTEILIGASTTPVRLSTLIFVPSYCFATRILTDSTTMFCVKSIRICISSSTVIPLNRSVFGSLALVDQVLESVPQDTAHIQRGIANIITDMIPWRKIRDFILQKR